MQADPLKPFTQVSLLYVCFTAISIDDNWFEHLVFELGRVVFKSFWAQVILQFNANIATECEGRQWFRQRFEFCVNEYIRRIFEIQVTDVEYLPKTAKREDTIKQNVNNYIVLIRNFRFHVDKIQLKLVWKLFLARLQYIIVKWTWRNWTFRVNLLDTPTRNRLTNWALIQMKFHSSFSIQLVDWIFFSNFQQLIDQNRKIDSFWQIDVIVMNNFLLKLWFDINDRNSINVI